MMNCGGQRKLSGSYCSKRVQWCRRQIWRPVQYLQGIVAHVVLRHLVTQKLLGDRALVEALLEQAEKGEGKKAAKLLYMTTAGGLIFLCIKGVEWTTEISHGMTISSNTFWSFYYTAAGIHALHVIAGMIIMLFVAQTAKRNEELQRVEIIGIYWHFVDIVWIFLFPLLYIAK